jgi:hypothetical protein
VRLPIALVGVSDIGSGWEAQGSYDAAFRVQPCGRYASTIGPDSNRTVCDLLLEADKFVRRSCAGGATETTAIVRDAFAASVDAAITEATNADNEAYPFHPILHRQLEATLAQLRELKRGISRVQIPENLAVSALGNFVLDGRHGFVVHARLWDLEANCENVRSHQVSCMEMHDAVFYHRLFSGYLARVSALRVTVRQFNSVAPGMTPEQVNALVGFTGEVVEGHATHGVFNGAIEWDNGYNLTASFRDGHLAEKDLVEL